jgi:hypothetical protein
MNALLIHYKSGEEGVAHLQIDEVGVLHFSID